MPSEPFCEIGKNAQIDDGVILGYQYPGCQEKLRVGDHAVIRAGTIIYADTVIGHRFSSGHQVIIRAKITIGDRVVVFHKCILEGKIRIGSGVKIMAHVYILSLTRTFLRIPLPTVCLSDSIPSRTTFRKATSRNSSFHRPISGELRRMNRGNRKFFLGSTVTGDIREAKNIPR